MNPLEGNDRYIFRKYLGAGAFGQVILADSIERKGPVAIKLLQRGNKITKHVRNEIVNHSLLKHPHVIAFHDLFLHGNYLCLALEYASGGNLYDSVIKSGGYTERRARNAFQQFMLGLHYCHRMGVASRDIKLENTLIVTSPTGRELIKICDFGYSKHEDLNSTPASTVGSLDYMAPEIFNRQYDGKKVDVWASGVMLYAMLFARYPFAGPPKEPTQDFVARATTGVYPLPPDRPVSQECKELLAKLLNPNATQRYSVEEVFKDKWFCKDLPASVESYNDQYAKDTAVNPALLSLLSEAQKALPGYEDELDEEEGSGMMLYDEDIDDMAELDPII